MFFFSELLFILEVIIISNLISVWFCFINKSVSYKKAFYLQCFFSRGCKYFESNLSLVLLNKSVSYKKAFHLQCFFSVNSFLYKRFIIISNVILAWFCCLIFSELLFTQETVIITNLISAWFFL